MFDEAEKNELNRLAPMARPKNIARVPTQSIHIGDEARVAKERMCVLYTRLCFLIDRR